MREYRDYVEALTEAAEDAIQHDDTFPYEPSREAMGSEGLYRPDVREAAEAYVRQKAFPDNAWTPPDRPPSLYIMEDLTRYLMGVRRANKLDLPSLLTRIQHMKAPQAVFDTHHSIRILESDDLPDWKTRNEWRALDDISRYAFYRDVIDRIHPDLPTPEILLRDTELSSDAYWDRVGSRSEAPSQDDFRAQYTLAECVDIYAHTDHPYVFSSDPSEAPLYQMAWASFRDDIRLS
jgi:hypothetical protein